jgi:hypothetical protein
MSKTIQLNEIIEGKIVHFFFVLLLVAYLDARFRTRTKYLCICHDLRKETVMISLVRMRHIAFSVED